LFEKIVQKYFEMNPLQKIVCFRCECEGHIASHCQKTNAEIKQKDAEIHFPALAPGKSFPTPSMKTPKNTFSKNHSQLLSSKPPNRYQNKVECTVNFWIHMLEMIFGSMWFRDYKSIPMKKYTDKFLEDVQNGVRDEAECRGNLQDLADEEAEIIVANKYAEIEAEERKERKALEKSMSVEAWERFRDEEDESYYNDLGEFGIYIPSLEIKQQAKWSEFLEKEEKSQEEFRERQVLKLYEGRPRKGLTLGSFLSKV